MVVVLALAFVGRSGEGRGRKSRPCDCGARLHPLTTSPPFGCNVCPVI